MNLQGIHRQFCIIADDARIGEGARIGNFVFIRENTIIGRGCTIGSYVDIEGDVRIGDQVSLQSGCYLTRGVVIEDEVFLRPAHRDPERQAHQPPPALAELRAVCAANFAGGTDWRGKRVVSRRDRGRECPGRSRLGRDP
jgi:UDP-2-acetamido-3-amino-2,3-dideoxy-glucuronate N-acetyltransferase